MAKVIEISPISALGADDEEPLRVAAYCRVSTDHEEQSSSLEMQERYYTRLIEQTPNWINAGIFSEKVSGLEVKKRQEFGSCCVPAERGKLI
jgi:DNA invertase Pin-like site-specific DNA recombinase